MTPTPNKQKNRTGENFRKKHKLKVQAESINLVAPGDESGQSVDSGDTTCSSPADSDIPNGDSEQNSNNPESDLPFIDSRYDVLELLGKGGMGSVYKVFDKTLNKIFAIKVLQPELAKDQVALKRFEQEVEATCQLEHHNLVATYGHGKKDDGTPYLIMDYLEGENLADLLAREGPLDAARSLNLWLQICEALAHAHKSGVIHRDMKPTNVIISKAADGTETVRVVDFGIAKILTSATRETHNLTETGAVFGSPHYMSPEHCLGFKMDERSDVYSLGCLMYEMLTGNAPFPDSNAVQVVVKHINEEAKPFPAEGKETKVGKRLESVTLKCLEKDAEYRYQSVNDIIKDLELIRDGKKPSKFVRQRAPRPEFTKKHIAAITVGVSLLSMLVWQYVGMVEPVVQKFLVSLVIFLLTFSGAIAFVIASIEHCKNLFAGHTSDRNWWRTLLVVSLAVSCLAYLDNATQLLFNWSVFSLFGKLPASLSDLIGTLPYINQGALVSSIIAAVGCLVFRSTKRSNISNMVFQWTVLTMLLLIISSTAIPKTMSELSRMASGGRLMDKYAPWLSEGMKNYSLLLDPRNQATVVSLAKLQVEQGRRADADKTYEKYFLREPLKNELAWAHFQRSKTYSNPEEKHSKYVELTEAIKLAPRHDFYEDRGMIFWERGKNEEALVDFYNASRCEPGAPLPYCRRALVFAGVGDLNMAILQLNRISSAEATLQHPEVYFIRGLILDKIGDPDASADFQRVIALSNTDKFYPDLQGDDLLWRVAYAYKRVGDTKNYEKTLEQLNNYSTHQESKDNLEKMLKRANLNLDWSAKIGRFGH